MTTQQDSIEDRLSRLETDMSDVKSDMSDVKSDIVELKTLFGEFAEVQARTLNMLEQVNRRTEDIALHMGVPKRNGTA